MLSSELLGLELLDAAGTSSGNLSDPGANADPLNLSALGLISVDLGGGLTLPLVSEPDGNGLLHLGQVGVLHSYASSPSATSSVASAGAVTEDGTIAIDPDDPGEYGPATVNLIDLLRQLGLDGVTNEVVDRLDLEIGALASQASVTDGVTSSEYVIAGADFNLSSQLVRNAAADLRAIVTNVGTTLNTAVGTGGVLSSALALVNVSAGIPGVASIQVGPATATIDDLDAAVADATADLLAPLSDPNGIVTIDLGGGIVRIDLEKIVDGGSLNGLDANTLLLDDTTIDLITDAVQAALGTLSTRVVTVVTDLVNDLDVTITLSGNLELLLGDAADFDVTVKAKLGQFTGARPGTPAVNVAGAVLGIPAGTILGAITTPVVNALTTALGTVVGGLITTATTGLDATIDGIVDPVLTALDPVLDALNEVVQITINEQPNPGQTGNTTPSDGHLGRGFTVSALSLELLPGLGAVNLDLASSSVYALADEPPAGPDLTATSPVQAGGSTAVTSSGWEPETQVTLQLTDAEGNPVGAPVVVTTDEDGNVPASTTVPVPAGTTPGTYTVVGSDAEGNEASDDIVVYAPTLDAETPVTPGDCSTITSGGWLPSSQVTLQLTDADGNPVGDPVVVTTDEDGNVPPTTCVPIPEDTEPGDYEIVGTDENDAEVSTPVTVEEAAPSPDLTATSPVPAGGSTTVTSGGWPARSEVTLQLTDAEGNPVGDPVVVEADEDGNLPATTTVPVPADAEAGTYTVVGSDAEGNEASDDIVVYAPTLSASSPVPAGGSTTVTSGGWLPNTEVTLQLTDADGDPVGDPVVVTTDGDGNVPAGTTVPVPAGTTPGEYSVVGTDENGAEASAPVTVEAAALTPDLTATSPVPAGGSTTVTSGGWAPGSEVTLQLTDAEGNPVGSPVVVEADEDGNLPATTTVPVPAEAEPGTYTVVGSDAEGNEASDDVLVYSPTLDAESPVVPGDCSAITSGGWLPSSQVTLQLTDADGNPVGEPVVVTTDAEGNVPPTTCVPIPEDTEPGDYEIVGTDENDAEVSTPVTVEEAQLTPDLTATSPVPAGGSTTVTSGGWAPGSEVTLQLTDAEGNPVGEPVVVEADEDGNLPATTTVPVPADAEPGTYTLVGSDADGNEASDDIVVYAPTLEAETPVAPGECAEITSGGWLPNTEVTLQLTDAEGNPVGEPVVVTTDGEGNVPPTTCVPIPDDAQGEHEIVGTDENGAEVSAPVLVVVPGQPALSASSPVPAGGSTTVTSGGWAPNTEVTLQLTDAEGNPVGEPVVVTTDGEGNVPPTTCVPIPDDAQGE
ncbi:MAG: choice-of-anchor G family protein, partial [Salana multivorans]|nr:choice-of-anchor G family protein [Salana multivorans]